MKKTSILLLFLFTSTLAWGQNALPITWVSAGGNNLKAMLNAGPTVTLSPTTAVMAVGYYAATNLAQVDTDLAAGNIATNVTIFGVAGTLSTTPAAMPKTGQTTLYAAKDDGDLEKGVAWPNPRFKTNNIPAAGTNVVTDNLTGLMWARNANLPGGTKQWTVALSYCTNMNVGAGTYGYTDWRMPNERELLSLTAYGQSRPALCNTAGTGPYAANDPFTGVQTSGDYWSSTTYAGNSANAWYLTMADGSSAQKVKAHAFSVWPVRGP